MTDFDGEQDDRSARPSEGSSAKETASSPALRPQIGAIRATPQATAPANVVRLRSPGEGQAAPSRQPITFETLRVIQPAQLRARLRRRWASLARKGEVQSFTPERTALLKILDEMHDQGRVEWPDVVVVRWPQEGPLRTNFAVLGSAIYLGAHLAQDWREGEEPPAFYATLADALREFLRRTRAQYGKTSVPKRDN